MPLLDIADRIYRENMMDNRASFPDRLSLQANALMKYVSQLDSDITERLSKPSPEAVQLMESNIAGMLGGLPSGQFDVAVTTSRESLGRLLASAMVSGYFLHSAEQRMSFEERFAAPIGSSAGSTEGEP
ncbi:MAG: DUF760 domain-containing protein [Geitlerinemataceae cyanobacterium]